MIAGKGSSVGLKCQLHWRDFVMQLFRSFVVLYFRMLTGNLLCLRRANHPSTEGEFHIRRRMLLLVPDSNMAHCRLHVHWTQHRHAKLATATVLDFLIWIHVFVRNVHVMQKKSVTHV